MERTYFAIDLKSFYASVECMARGLDPLTTHLVVADERRTDKTICLAVSPSLKALGLPGRPRLYQVKSQVRSVNAARKARLEDPEAMRASSFDAPALQADPLLAVDFLIAPPRMAHYIQASSEIYQIYLRYVAAEDIHVYSVDEVFIDITDYLPLYQMSARALCMRMILDVLEQTGITATAGIGPNLYLAKIAMDIEAKKMAPDENGVRMAQLDVRSYREKLWTHRPITDFWRVGRGTAQKLARHDLFTMGEVALFSLQGGRQGEDLLYRLFGINAELLIDHAWGYESTRMADIKAYRPEGQSLSNGQVLSEPYPYDKARLIVREMADGLSLDLIRQGLVCDHISLTIEFDVENLKDPARRARYQGPIRPDAYGRPVPKPAHKSRALPDYTASTQELMAAFTALFEAIVPKALLVRRLYVVADRVKPESEWRREARQLSFLEDLNAQASGASVKPATDEKQASTHDERPSRETAIDPQKERQIQETILALKEKYGKNVILRGMNLEEGATARDRNKQIGGHEA